MDRANAFLELTEIERKSLLEASLSRILKHTEDGKPFAMLTAYISEYNQRAIDLGIGPQAPANRKLIADAAPEDREGLVQKMREEVNIYNKRAQLGLMAEVGKYGFIRLVGVYQYDSGEKSREPSLFVIGIPEDEAVALGKKYWQESVVTGQQGRGVYLMYCFSSKIEILSDHINLQSLEVAWSDWRKRQFGFKMVTLETASIVPDSRTAHFEHVKAVSEALHRRYGVARVELALDEIARGSAPSEAVDRMLSGGNA